MELEEDNILEFVLRRFMIEFGKQMTKDMGERVPVVLTTSTDFVDESGSKICNPPITKKAEAIIPAIEIRGLDITENRTDFTAAFRNEAATRAIGTERITGVNLRNPARTYDITMDLRFFHNKMTRMLRMKRAAMRYFDACPYLFIPRDTKDKQAKNVGSICELLEAYDCGDDISDKGVFLEQEIPFTGAAFTSTSGSNNDNLYVCDSAAMIKQVVLPDEVDLGFVGNVREGQIIFVELNDNDDIPIAIIDLEELNG